MLIHLANVAATIATDRRRAHGGPPAIKHAWCRHRMPNVATDRTRAQLGPLRVLCDYAWKRWSPWHL